MSEPTPDGAATYAIVIVRDDGSHLMIESGLAKERAETMRTALRGSFRDVLMVWQPPPVKTDQSPPG